MWPEVRIAFDGLEALRVADEFGPDVVILEINMPLADCYEVAKTLGAARHGQQFIIAMTGASARETAEKAMHAGFDVHWVKPVGMDQLTGFLDGI